LKDPDVQAILAMLLEKNRGKPAEPTFLYRLASSHKGWGQPTPENEKKAKSLFAELVKKFPNSAQAKEAQGDIFELEATDQDGKTWSLKEYKGKVVVLDFWGFW
jgi:TolA-binding protein